MKIFPISRMDAQKVIDAMKLKASDPPPVQHPEDLVDFPDGLLLWTGAKLKLTTRERSVGVQRTYEVAGYYEDGSDVTPVFVSAWSKHQ